MESGTKLRMIQWYFTYTDKVSVRVLVIESGSMDVMVRQDGEKRTTSIVGVTPKVGGT